MENGEAIRNPQGATPIPLLKGGRRHVVVCCANRIMKVILPLELA